MNATLTTAPSSALAAYARNVTKSHTGWRVELATGGERVASVAGQPLRGLQLVGEDLVLETGAGPGRPHRYVLSGPLAFSRQHRGMALELHLTGPHDALHELVLRPA